MPRAAVQPDSAKMMIRWARMSGSGFRSRPPPTTEKARASKAALASRDVKAEGRARALPGARPRFRAYPRRGYGRRSPWGAQTRSRSTKARICSGIAFLHPTGPDYGALIGALSSVQKLQGVQGECKVLHDARCRYSEIPHAGERADEATMTTARTCFVKIAKACVGNLDSARGQ
jgi:hypothetical protein